MQGVTHCRVASNLALASVRRGKLRWKTARTFDAEIFQEHKSVSHVANRAPPREFSIFKTTDDDRGNGPFEKVLRSLSTLYVAYVDRKEACRFE